MFVITYLYMLVKKRETKLALLIILAILIIFVAEKFVVAESKIKINPIINTNVVFDLNFNEFFSKLKLTGMQVKSISSGSSCDDPCGGCISPSICMVNCCCLPGQKCVAVGTNDDGSTKYDCQDSCPQGNSACGDSCCEATTEECINNQCLPKCDSDEKRCSTGDCCPMDVDCLPGGGCGISCTGVLCRNENNPEDPMECCDSDKICKSAGGGYYRNCVVDLCANTGSGACCFKYIESGPYLFESYHCQEVGKLECARFPSDCDCVSDRRTECCDIYPDAQGC